ncbi:MAG: hypothetical protein H7Y36_07815 [Armatimonadetes bacterium]|nr:hypothetical protein [Akkermansiaceae bacterium]
MTSHFLTILACSLVVGTISCDAEIIRTSWQGWEEAWIIRSKTAETVIVPEIGRIMQFGFRDKPGVFWNNRKLAGKSPDPLASEWQNFGGEKVWPAPQNCWPIFGIRDWPPPSGFDSTSSTILKTPDGTADTIKLLWPEDTQTGIRMTREISLADSSLTVTTHWDRLHPGPSPLAIWTVAQLRHPEECFIAKPSPGVLPPQLLKLSKDFPPSLRELPNSHSLTRDSKLAYKVGSSGNHLLWADAETLLHIHILTKSNAIQPDGGSRIQIYTNADDNPYIELETLGSLQIIPSGSRISETLTYSLLHRDPDIPLDQIVLKMFQP